MNSAPLLLLPLAAMALFSSQPDKAPLAARTDATASVDAADIAPLLDKPEFRALTKQLQEATGLLDLPDESDQPARHARHSKKEQNEQGLHTSHLAAPEGYYSAARGLTPADEWQEMFPRYALKFESTR